MGDLQHLNRLLASLVGRMLFRAKYRETQPSAADLFLLYYRLERWGA